MGKQRDQVYTLGQRVRGEVERILPYTGPGIHKQLWEKIFALGFSTRPGGTGLGLFIARGLVESLGGRISVERSVVPIGTTFLVELPRSPSQGGVE